MARQLSYPGLDLWAQPQRDVIRMIWDRIHSLEGQAGGSWQGAQDAGQNVIKNLGVAQVGTDALSRDAADARYAPDVVRAALQSSGASPLYVGGLRGVLADAQHMGITVIPNSYTALPLAETYVQYQVVSWQSSLYYVNPTTNPMSWTKLVSSGMQFDIGTLSPDTKPTLTAADVGHLFFATDFNRLFRWSGTAWTDFPGSDPRGVVVLSYEPTLMPNGWAVCDGSTVNMSSALGTVFPYVTPNPITLNQFPRFAATEGGTGGSSNTSNTLTGLIGLATAALGSDQDVAADDHLHTNSLPPYMDFVPYIRL